MIILGTAFLGADDSYSPTPTNVNKIKELTISNGTYDTLAVTKDIDMEQAFDIDTAWDYNTIMLATYDNNINAGNMGFAMNNTSDIIIKRREKGTYHWTTIFHKKIETENDFHISFLDYFFKNNTVYEYACVGLFNGAENDYSIKEIDSRFHGIFICDKDKIYCTQMDIGSCDTSRIHYIAKKESLIKRYPFTYANSNTNYETGSVSGYFAKYDTVSHDFYPDESLAYRKELTDFLSDNKPKILRHEDGRIWLINIDGEISDTMDGHELHRITEFNWFESGDYNSEKDLYNSGLSDVSNEFWSSE